MLTKKILSLIFILSQFSYDSSALSLELNAKPKHIQCIYAIINGIDPLTEKIYPIFDTKPYILKPNQTIEIKEDLIVEALNKLGADTEQVEIAFYVIFSESYPQEEYIFVTKTNLDSKLIIKTHNGRFNVQQSNN